MDFLRGGAALIVVFAHSANFFGIARFGALYFDTGRLGVSTFFLVSGFVIPLTLEKSDSIRAFAINRLFRLYPLYWASITILALWIALRVPLDDGYYAVFERHLGRNLLVNATMLQEFVRVPDAIPVYWTLTVELIFYAFCAVLYKVGLLARSIAIAWWAIALTFFVAVLLPCVTHHRVPFEHIFAFPLFFCGTAVYRHFTGAASNGAVIGIGAGLLVLMLAGVACNYYFFSDSSEQIRPLAASCAYLGTFAAFCLAYVNRKRSYPKFFLWLGAVSYSAYLLHSLVIEAVVALLGEPARCLVGLPATFVISTLTYQFLEKPIVAIGHRLAKRYAIGARIAIARSA